MKIPHDFRSLIGRRRADAFQLHRPVLRQISRTRIWYLTTHGQSRLPYWQVFLCREADASLPDLSVIDPAGELQVVLGTASKSGDGGVSRYALCSRWLKVNPLTPGIAPPAAAGHPAISCRKLQGAACRSPHEPPDITDVTPVEECPEQRAGACVLIRLVCRLNTALILTASSAWRTVFGDRGTLWAGALRSTPTGQSPVPFLL